MSILSLLQDDTLETPPLSTNTSFDIGHATAQARPVLGLEFTTSPVNDAALSATAATTAAAAGRDKGKGEGRDAELYDINPSESGNTHETSHVDRSEEKNFDTAQSLLRLKEKNNIDLELYDHKDAGNTAEEKNPRVYRSDDVFETAQSLLRLRYIANEVDRKDVEAAFGLVDLRYDLKNCGFEQLLDDDEDEDEDGDEGLPTARNTKRSCTYCHGKKGVHHGYGSSAAANEGNALVELLSERFVRRGEEELCWPCFLLLDSIRARYERGYERLGFACGGFEREETVEVDDAAAAVDEENHPVDMMMVSKPPLLSQKTLDKLEEEKREWRSRRPEPDPDHLPATTRERTSSSSSVPVVSETGRLTRAAMYAKESYVRPSVIPSAAEVTASQHAINDNDDTSSSRPRRRGRLGFFDGRRKGSVALTYLLTHLLTHSTHPTHRSKPASHHRSGTRCL